MIRAFFDIINQYDPDILTGYNIDNFDFNYTINRAIHLKMDFFDFSRLSGYRCSINEKTF